MLGSQERAQVETALKTSSYLREKPYTKITITAAEMAAAGSRDIGFPFTGVFVSSATDTITTVNLTPVGIDDVMESLPLTLRDSFELPEPARRGKLSWSVQAGKTIDIYFFFKGVFRSGKQITTQSGTVQIGEGSNAPTVAQVALSAGSAGILFAASSTRLKGTVVNDTGAPVYLGPSTITGVAGANRGLILAPGASFEYRGAAALYAICAAAVNLYTMEES